MAVTYEPIATYTVSGTTTNTFTFSSIPSTYTDLVLIANLNDIGAVAVLRGRFNGDTGANYSSTAVHGDGTTAGSSRQGPVDAFYMTFNAHVGTSKGVGIYHFMSYANTTFFKTIISSAANIGFGADIISSLWRSTAAINSITVLNDRAEYWTAGSTLTLYGIKAA